MGTSIQSSTTTSNLIRRENCINYREQTRICQRCKIYFVKSEFTLQTHKNRSSSKATTAMSNRQVRTVSEDTSSKITLSERFSKIHQDKQTAKQSGGYRGKEYNRNERGERSVSRDNNNKQRKFDKPDSRIKKQHKTGRDNNGKKFDKNDKRKSDKKGRGDKKKPKKTQEDLDRELEEFSRKEESK
jgi:hypothetical protein